MDLRAAVRSQYHAALTMLEQAVRRCPENLWDHPEDTNKTWRVAYHALFYTHLYLQPTLEDFVPWSKHRERAERFEPREEAPPATYTPEELLEYLDLCRAQVDERTATLHPDAPSGFSWWSQFDKLEFQFYNIRHLQQHVGELMERLGARAGVSVDWVGGGR